MTLLASILSDILAALNIVPDVTKLITDIQAAIQANGATTPATDAAQATTTAPSTGS